MFSAQANRKCPHCKEAFEMPAFIVLIMVISVMEKLASVDCNGVESWVDFYDWISDKDLTQEYWQALRDGKYKDFKQLIDELKTEYSAKFGSRRKITSFLSTFMSQDEKRALINSIRYYQKVPALPPNKPNDIESSKDFNEVWKKVQDSIRENQKVTFENQEDVKKYVEQKGHLKLLLKLCPYAMITRGTGLVML